MKEYDRKAEQQLLELMEEREEKDRELLRLEIFIGVLVTVVLLVCVFTASFVHMEAWARAALIIAGFLPFVIGVVYAVKIEQIAGFYECQRCGHKYVPTFSKVFFCYTLRQNKIHEMPRLRPKELAEEGHAQVTWHGLVSLS